MSFGFHATLVYTDKLCRRLSFADGDEESGDHYFVMDRSEESPEDALPDMDNVYIERDDQCWGGYGGIEQVVLDRGGLTLHLNQRMEDRMGGHDVIRISFDIPDQRFQTLEHILGLIMRGYETRLTRR